MRQKLNTLHVDNEFIIFDDDEFVLTDDQDKFVPMSVSDDDKKGVGSWKILVVDDEPEIHTVTKLALRKFTFADKPISFISAFSTEETIDLLHSESDIALILLDVVMEKKDSGLSIAQYIRKELDNQLVRIILRTGQPGEAPEESIILDYAINDYKTKSELTRAKLYTTIVSALRSYQDIITLEAGRKEIEALYIDLAEQSAALQKANTKLQNEITERRRAEVALNQALNQAEQERDKTEIILQSVTDGLIVTDSQDKVVLVNKAAQKMLNSRLSEALNQPIQDVLQHDDLGIQLQQALSQKLSNDQFYFEQPSDEAQTNAPTRIIEARFASVKNRSSDVTGVVTILRDMTREREIDRMKTEFVSTAAHELRTPLTSIQGFSEILLSRRNLPPEKQQKYLIYINNKAIDLAGIVNDLLNISRIESGATFELDVQSYSISGTVNSVINTYQTCYAQRRFEVDLADLTCQWAVDAQKIEQVFENLLSNAVKFSPDGTSIYITGKRVAEASTPNYYQISIRDEGLGMTSEQVDKLFDKFLSGQYLKRCCRWIWPGYVNRQIYC